MTKKKFHGCILIFFILTWFAISQARADGGFVSTESVALSADQRAIIIKNGNEISMTFSTGYTGEGEDFGWIIPTPVPPAIEDISETGENGETAFKILDEYSSPKITSGGCFSSGTEVITASGPRAIETVDPGTEIYAYNPTTGEWVLTRVLKRQSFQYEGDMIDIRMGDITIRATGNHPFYVLSGERLASRPLPRDVPKGEQRMIEHGRWVEARDLKEGDVLKVKSGEGLSITSLSSRHQKIEVYNLDVKDYHNYAVHQKGILVHNKGGKETSESVVKVYGKVTLEHYEVSIVGAAAASALLNWLQKNDYQVNPAAKEVIKTYIDRNWAFVAVKLNPSEGRHYENEFLPPLTIQYQSEQLIFPLYISSVSTTQTIRITLYVIAESTVYSSNFSTRTLRYNRDLLAKGDPQSYVEACIQETIGSEDRALIVMWRGEFFREEVIDELMKIPFSEGKKNYLTRIETRIDPAALTEDIRFKFDWRPKKFRVHSEGSEASVAFRTIIFLILAFIFLILAFIIVVGLPVGFLIGLVLLIRLLVRRLRQRQDRQDRRERDKAPR